MVQWTATRDTPATLHDNGVDEALDSSMRMLVYWILLPATVTALTLLAAGGWWLVNRLYIGG